MISDSKYGLQKDYAQTQFLIIDPQVDFITGSLKVEGAVEDMKRISDCILDNMGSIGKIHITLDTHQRNHIAHACMWKNEAGERPAPFTLISSAEIESGKWQIERKELKDHAINYCKALEKGGKFNLIIWPEHCIVGTPGHNVWPVLQHALGKWTDHHCDTVGYVFKGLNPLVESYSALRAEYLVEDDDSTKLNTELIGKLKAAKRVVVSGEAKSHCVNYTVRDLVANWPADRMADIWLVEDAMTSVGGYDESGNTFIEDMRKQGLTICKAADVFK